MKKFLAIIFILCLTVGASAAVAYVDGISVPVGTQSVVIRSSNAIGAVTTATYSVNGTGDDSKGFSDMTPSTGTGCVEVSTLDIFNINISEVSGTEGTLIVFFGDVTNQVYVMINLYKVRAASLNDGAITANSIAANAIANAKIADNAISAGKIAANAITDAKIASGAITDAKIASGAITNAKIADNAISAAKIAAEALTGVKIDATFGAKLKAAIGTKYL